jgi:hypothetical protein
VLANSKFASNLQAKIEKNHIKPFLKVNNDAGFTRVCNN